MGLLIRTRPTAGPGVPDTDTTREDAHTRAESTRASHGETGPADTGPVSGSSARGSASDPVDGSGWNQHGYAGLAQWAGRCGPDGETLPALTAAGGRTGFSAPEAIRYKSRTTKQSYPGCSALSSAERRKGGTFEGRASRRRKACGPADRRHAGLRTGDHETQTSPPSWGHSSASGRESSEPWCAAPTRKGPRWTRASRAGEAPRVEQTARA